MNGAQSLVEMLIRYETKVVFGLPGDTGIGFYDALHAESGRITHIMARDERSAAFMADVYARLTGKPGICEGPSGAGATYLLPGIVEAQQSSVALLALTTDNPLDDEAQGALTALDQPALFRATTKWTTLVKRAELLPRFVRRAFRLATSGRPGAVHLALPKDILAAEMNEPLDLHSEAACTTWPAHRARPASAAVSRTARRLLAAQRPVIIAGGGAVSAGAQQELLALAEYLGAPVATTINGKGAIAETHPLSLGVVGANGGRACAHRVIAEADLVLFVGSRVNYVDTDSWRIPPLTKPPVIVQIDVDAAELGNNYPIEEGLCGDAQLALRDLLEALPEAGPPADQTAWREFCAGQKAAWLAQMRAAGQGSTRPIHPRRVIAELQRALSDEAVLVCDPGTPTPYVAAEFELRRPGRWTITPRAQGGLGYAIPGVVGARLGRPQATIVGLCGDGSFAIAAGDLATMARVGGPIVLLVFNNGCYGWIKALQRLHCAGRYFSVDFPEALDFIAVARGFGLRGRRIEDPDEIAPALRQALGAGEPYVLEFVVAGEHEALPPVAPWQRLMSEGLSDSERRG